MTTKKPLKPFQQPGFTPAADTNELLNDVLSAFPKPEPERKQPGVLGDTGRGIMSGLAGIAKAGGDLYGLATGNMDNAVSEAGKNAQEYWESGQSGELKRRKAERSAHIDAADGMLGKAGAAIWDTVTDPRLALDTVATNATSFIPSAAAAKGVQAARLANAVRTGEISLEAANALKAGKAIDSASKVVAESSALLGKNAAIGAGAVQQGADVASNVYDSSMQKTDEQWNQNPEFVRLTEELAGGDPTRLQQARQQAKHDLSLKAARITLPAAAAISVVANSLPGADSIERVLAGGVARDTVKQGTKYALPKTMLKHAGGEALGEAIEEGGGQYAGNVSKQRYVDPNQDATEGVGENAGMGAAGGMLMGAGTGALHRQHAPGAQTPPPAPAVQPVLQAETGVLARAANAGQQASADKINAQAAQQTDTQPESIEPALSETSQAAPAPSGSLDDNLKQQLVTQALNEKKIKVGEIRAERFRDGINDAVDGKPPAAGQGTSYGEGHAWALNRLGGPSAEKQSQLQPATNANMFAPTGIGELSQLESLHAEQRAQQPQAAPEPSLDEQIAQTDARRIAGDRQRAQDARNAIISDVVNDPSIPDALKKDAFAKALVQNGYANPVLTDDDHAAIDSAIKAKQPIYTPNEMPVDELVPARTEANAPQKKANFKAVDEAAANGYKLRGKVLVSPKGKPFRLNTDELAYYKRKLQNESQTTNGGGASAGVASQENAAELQNADARAISQDRVQAGVGDAGRLSEGGEVLNAGVAPADSRDALTPEVAPNLEDVLTPGAESHSAAFASYSQAIDEFVQQGEVIPYRFIMDMIDDERLSKDEVSELEDKVSEAIRKIVLDKEAHSAATSPSNDLPEPTEAQKDAGNYKKGHVRLHGLDIAIENPQGSKRSGVDRDGKAWENTIAHHYGYIKGTVGADKDHIDVFIGEKPTSDKVFVVDQVHPDSGKFDEHKILLGFNSMQEAEQAYRANYDPSWKGGKQISETTVAGFKEWLDSGKTKKPFAPIPRQSEQQAAPGVPDATAGGSQPEPVAADVPQPPAKPITEAQELNRKTVKVMTDEELRRAANLLPKRAESIAKEMKRRGLDAAAEEKPAPAAEKKAAAIVKAENESQVAEALEAGNTVEMPNGQRVQLYENGKHGWNFQYNYPDMRGAWAQGSMPFVPGSTVTQSKESAINGALREFDGQIKRAMKLAGPSSAKNEPSEQYRSYINWMAENGPAPAGMREQIQSDERLNDGEAEKLLAVNPGRMYSPDGSYFNIPQAKRAAKSSKTVVAAKEEATVPASKPAPEPTEKEKAQQDLDDALADLADIFGKNAKLNMMPEQEHKLLPVMVRVFDAAFRLGYHSFKQSAQFVLDTIAKKLGQEVSDQISIDQLQGAYIAMSGKREGATSKRDVVNVESKEDLRQVEQQGATASSDAKQESVPIEQAVTEEKPKTDSKPLSQIMVTVDVTNAATGKTAKLKVPANIALRQVDKRIDVLRNLLACMRG